MLKQNRFIVIFLLGVIYNMEFSLKLDSFSSIKPEVRGHRRS